MSPLASGDGEIIPPLLSVVAVAQAKRELPV